MGKEHLMEAWKKLVPRLLFWECSWQMNRILIEIHCPWLVSQLNCGFITYFYGVFVVLCWFGEWSRAPGLGVRGPRLWDGTILEFLWNLLIPSIKFAKWIIREGFLRSFFSSILVNVYWKYNHLLILKFRKGSKGWKDGV